MRCRLGIAACLLLVAPASFGQEWIEYRNTAEGFAVSAPGQPSSESLAWKSKYDAVFPG